ncbi:tRNA (adenine-N(1)-)-methyltransferase catalytic subunit trm61 [Orbilia brochopaga]|uniref:tRNA (adenine(58)-N(1))-methyltransferase catalytic subunit TRM61 n=1 Tax=Orbilia brochopaga TaxID=3140254 RepID=A0AAV9V4Q7_9PEZI
MERNGEAAGLSSSQPSNLYFAVVRSLTGWKYRKLLADSFSLLRLCRAQNSTFPKQPSLAKDSPPAPSPISPAPLSRRRQNSPRFDCWDICGYGLYILSRIEDSMAAAQSQPAPPPPGASSMVTVADSPFLPGPYSSHTILPNSRAIAHLTRDVLQSVLVQPSAAAASVAAGSPSSTPEPVANLKRKQPTPANSTSLHTRFGSFPHSGLLVPAGSQVRSSSGSGFIHILRPTPELWTLSLPHRTQVVYTPDSSYILHRLRVRPGSRVIEAGAGSGSFTHAAARAVYNGVHKKTTGGQSGEVNGDGTANGSNEGQSPDGHDDSQGRVLSFEFHADRAAILRHELQQHGLHSIVTVTSRDVCAGGFALTDPELDIGGNTYATAVFLDLPAPWLAIPHLTREKGSLSRTKPVRICCFSPCLEQALRTIAVLREQGWVEEDLVEVAHKRLEVRRVGPDGKEIGSKPRAGATTEDDVRIASVEESVARLKKQLWHRKEKQARQRARSAKKRKLEANGAEEEQQQQDDDSDAEMDIVDDYDDDVAAADSRKEDNGGSKLHLFHQGRVVVRTEPELKTHTSYLVFAVLPLPWTEQDEADAQSKHPIPPRPAPQLNPKTGRDYSCGGFAPKPMTGKLSKSQERKLRKAADKAARLAAAGDKSAAASDSGSVTQAQGD